ncbi:hypothetical protein Ntsu_32380 [Nocardia sp. IFM 10818]
MRESPCRIHRRQPNYRRRWPNCFGHIDRHHRRYRIAEGAEEIQMRRVAGYLFGFMDRTAVKGV